MNTIDHGTWNVYTPASLPQGAPPSALFAQRQSDNVDWYDYVHPGTNFNAANVVIAAFYRTATSQYIIGPATYDATEIFPGGCIVHEVTDYAGSDPQGDLGSKAFDPATGAVTDPIIPQSDLAARLKALETKLGGA